MKKKVIFIPFLNIQLEFSHTNIEITVLNTHRERERTLSNWVDFHIFFKKFQDKKREIRRRHEITTTTTIKILP